MNPTILLQWQYLIFLLPGAVSALLLILSSLRFGHRGGHLGGHGGVHGPMGGHGGLRLGTHGHAVVQGAAHAPAVAQGTHGGAAHSASAHGHAPAPTPLPKAGLPKVHARVGKVEVTRNGANKENVTFTTNLALHITGADRAPLMMILELFCLVWGVSGYWANQFVLHSANPTPGQMFPVLGIALGCGIVGARLGAEVLARTLPQDESLDVSRDGLFGLVGEVAFPVSATAGRIHVYDEHGTLHDETCRLAPGHETIIRGRAAMVVDIDSQGNLVVEEVPNSAR